MMPNSPANTHSIAGKNFHSQKKYSQAIDEFRIALEEFVSLNDSVSVAEMKNNIGVCLQMQGKAEEAIKEIEGTAKVFAEQGKLEYEAMALGNEASALEDLKRFDEALSLYEQAEKLLDKEPKSEIRSIILKRISAIELKKGNQMASLASMNIALNSDPNPSKKEKSLRNVLTKFFRLLIK